MNKSLWSNLITIPLSSLPDNYRPGTRIVHSQLGDYIGSNQWDVDALYLFAASAVVFVAAILIMPKRISWLEMYATAGFAIAFGCVADIFLDLRLQLYWYFTKQPDWATLWLFLGMYPTFNAIFLNFFPASRPKQLVYIGMTSLLLFAYDQLALKTGVIHYGLWKWWYSALCYPIILVVLYLNWVVTRHLLQKYQLRASPK